MELKKSRKLKTYALWRINKAIVFNSFDFLNSFNFTNPL